MLITFSPASTLRFRQGVFRGLADTRTPLYATVAAACLNVVLGWGLIFGARLGVPGAAAATVASQVRAYIRLGAM